MMQPLGDGGESELKRGRCVEGLGYAVFECRQPTGDLDLFAPYVDLVIQGWKFLTLGGCGDSTTFAFCCVEPFLALDRELAPS